MKKLLNDSIKQLNFAGDPDQCTEHINHFVEETTRNHIKNLIQPNKITSDTQFIMVNAVYFTGQWVGRIYVWFAV